MKIDIVICTYNRPEKVLELVNQLNDYANNFDDIILVDSSDLAHPVLSSHEHVVYLRSPYKNQPFQRYFGYSHSKADVLIFLDDDMEVANPDFLKIIASTFKDDLIAGLAIKFSDKHADTSLAAIPKSVLFKGMTGLKKIVGWISGYPELPNGKFGLCGLRGKQPLNGGKTEWLSGGAFAARKAALFQNFNFQLFDLFEEKMGMGEDAIIGYGLNKQGVLLYNAELMFYHNDQRDSAYSVDHFAYARRVIFSRLYLSLEKTRLDGGSYVYATLHYHWYVLWRVTGLFVNYLIKKTATKSNILKGSIEGWKKARQFKFDRQLKSTVSWQIIL
ncbi:MAG: glycosyltransferase [Ferruginibacter sp.]